MRKRVAYAQNFLKNKGLIASLIQMSSISSGDVVYDIGAGQGIITEELLKKSRKVVAFEIDKNLSNKLEQRYKSNKLVEIISGDFLSCSLPVYSYKVFSNIPFSISSAVIKKITHAKNPPDDAYIVVQKEVAKKFIGKPYANRNSQIAILLKPWFELSVRYEFKRGDFFPKPNVDAVLLRVKKIDKPLIEEGKRDIYQDFVVYAFNQFCSNIVEGLINVFGEATLLKMSEQLGFSHKSKPSELDFKQWLGLFNYFSGNVKSKQKLVRGSYARLIDQQGGLRKIHRIRTDKKWIASRLG